MDASRLIAYCPASPEEVARAFRGRLTPQRRARVRAVLETLAVTGAIQAAEPGARYFAPA